MDIVKNFGGNAIKTSDNHETGTDRIFEVFKETLNSEPNIIINLQGDMPNLESQAISNLVSYMGKNKCDIGTLASDLNSEAELDNPNVVKVAVKEKLSNEELKEADKVIATYIKKYGPQEDIDPTKPIRIDNE